MSLSTQFLLLEQEKLRESDVPMVVSQISHLGGPRKSDVCQCLYVSQLTQFTEITCTKNTKNILIFLVFNISLKIN